MEQIPHDVRGIERVCESRLSQGAFLRAEVQGAEGGQGDVGILHQTVRLSRPVPSHRHELQPSREGIALPFLREEGDGIAIQVGEADYRPCETEPEDCGAFEGNVCQVGTTEGIIPSLTGEASQIHNPANERITSGDFIADHIIIGQPVLYAKDKNRPKSMKI